MSTDEQNAAATSLDVTKNKVVEIHYSLYDTEGQELESTRDAPPRAFLVGHRGILAGLEEALLGKTAGEKVDVTLPPERAFGLRDEKLKERMSKKYFKHVKRLEAGMLTQVNTKNGPRPITIIKVGSKMVDVDLNHPRAGQTLKFAIEVVSVREATEAELSHGHAHGAGGHQH